MTTRDDHPHDYKSSLISALDSTRYQINSLRWELERNNITLGAYTAASEPFLRQQLELLALLREWERPTSPEVPR